MISILKKKKTQNVTEQLTLAYSVQPDTSRNNLDHQKF